MLGISEGYFEDEGIDVESVDLGGSSRGVLALAQGEIDVSTGGTFIGLFNAIAKGERIQIVADKGHADESCPAYAVMARAALIDGEELKSWDGVRGKTVSIRPSSTDEYIFDRILSRSGLSRDDLRIVKVGGSAAVGAFETGELDLRVCGEPTVTRLRQAGTAKVWLSLDEISKGMQFANLLYGKRLLDDDPETGHKFMRAYLRGVRKYNEGKTERNIEVINEFTKLAPSLLRDLCWPAVHDDGKINIQPIEDFLDWAYEAGHLETRIGPERYWNPEFVNRAYAELTSGQ